MIAKLLAEKAAMAKQIEELTEQQREELAAKDKEMANDKEKIEELTEQLRTQLATKDKEIDALTKQVGKLNVKPGAKIVGQFGNESGTIMRAVYKGTKGTESYFYKNPGGTNKYLKSDEADMWVFKEEAEVLAALAAHETKMAAIKASSPAK